MDSARSSGLPSLELERHEDVPGGRHRCSRRGATVAPIMRNASVASGSGRPSSIPTIGPARTMMAVPASNPCKTRNNRVTGTTTGPSGLFRRRSRGRRVVTAARCRAAGRPHAGGGQDAIREASCGGEFPGPRLVRSRASSGRDAGSTVCVSEITQPRHDVEGHRSLFPTLVRAAREFGFRATTPLEEGLKRTMKWFTTHNQKALVRERGKLLGFRRLRTSGQIGVARVVLLRCPLLSWSGPL